MPQKILEVIVTSAPEALEAEAGGADRLEVVRRLELGGLTPEMPVLEGIIRTVSVPIRVMLRETASMSVGSSGELDALREHARQMTDLGVGGVVLGFVREGHIDTDTVAELLEFLPDCSITFHRAFETLGDPLAGLDQLKSIAQVDRVLSTGGQGPWEERKRRLLRWQSLAGERIRFIVAAGLDAASVLSDLRSEPQLSEFHVGRAARFPSTNDGQVLRTHISALKRLVP